MLKKVSIIVPIYNVEKYLSRCIESLMNQSYRQLEIVLVNDGSPDNSVKICEYYATIDSRIKIIHKENGGLSDARNKGIDASTGEYIIFIDSDDYVELDLVENAMVAINKYKTDTVVWGYYADFVNENEELLERKVYKGLEGVIDSTKQEFKLNTELLNLLGYAWNKLYKSEVIKDNNYKFKTGLSLVEDITFNSELFKEYPSIAFIKEPKNHYMQRPRETLGAKLYREQFEIKYEAMEKAKSMFLNLGYPKYNVDKLINNTLFNSLKTIHRLLAHEYSYTQEDKRNYLLNLYKNYNVKNILENVELNSYKDHVLRELMQKKMYKIILKMYSLKNYRIG